jgi:hypothetical protein
MALGPTNQITRCRSPRRQGATHGVMETEEAYESLQHSGLASTSQAAPQSLEDVKPARCLQLCWAVFGRSLGRNPEPGLDLSADQVGVAQVEILKSADTPLGK